MAIDQINYVGDSTGTSSGSPGYAQNYSNWASNVGSFISGMFSGSGSAKESGNISNLGISGFGGSNYDFSSIGNAYYDLNKPYMDWAAKEAQKNRDWQERMSNTAHQREVDDLIAAGLNPVLSANGGNGAAVGSGATASGNFNAQGAISLIESMMNSQATIGAAALSNSAKGNTLKDASSIMSNIARSAYYLGHLMF